MTPFTAGGISLWLKECTLNIFNTKTAFCYLCPIFLQPLTCCD